ncbi:MAG: hypothetical protein WCD37_00645 [Chloroflexia bacterium]
MSITGKIGQMKLSGVAALLVAGSLLLAACGPEGTPTTTTTINTTVPSSGSTSTAVSGVTAEPTVSTDSPRVDTPVASETSTPGAMLDSTATPGAMMDSTATPGMLETPGAVLEGDTIKVVMKAQNGSNQSGVATLTDMKDGSVNVVLDIAGPGTTEPQPTHIHRGTCADLDPNPAFPLSNAVDGKSVTEISTNFAGFTSATNKFAINVHKSAAEASVYVSCGDISVEGMEGAAP